MSLYTIKNTTKSGSVHVGVRGVNTLGPGKSKVVELSDADRYHPDIVTLSSQGHISVDAFDEKVAKAEAAKAESDAKTKAEAEAKAKAKDEAAAKSTEKK